MNGLIHLYTGEGKGKTTSVMGLALRAMSAGKKAIIVQFLKNGKSNEILALEKLGAETFSTLKTNKFTWNMNENELLEVTKTNNEVFDKVVASDCDILILDEICSTAKLNLMDIEKLEQFLKNKPKKLEVVMTGREPLEFMVENADYITNMQKIKHPFDNGMQARVGIEY